MAGRKAAKGQSMFDALIGELMRAGEESLVDLCLSGDSRKIASVPLRYRLIALGFVKGLTLEALNQKLIENGCDQLYARSLWEATLIFAFKNGMKYEAWKELGEECADLRDEIKEGKGALSSPSVSLADIREYVSSNSLRDKEIAMTQHRTKSMESRIAKIRNDKEAFREFALSNIHSFSTVREKTRYYFCKYLMYYLQTRMEQYFDALRRGGDRKEALEILSPFRVRTALDRKIYPEQEAREMITGCGLSLGELYDAFQGFYFECISLDWLQIRMENIGDLAELEGEEKRRVAAAVRSRSKAYRELSDDEVIDRVQEEMERREEEADARYSRDNRAASYQTGRSGGNYIRKVLRGTLDLDRVTFLAFLLFFGREAQVPEGFAIHAERLDEILKECGFPALSRENGCDAFFLEFLETDDPMYFVMDKAEEMALSEENFYLYKTYLSSVSSDRKWEEITETDA